jgi:hypothetical protein
VTKRLLVPIAASACVLAATGCGGGGGGAGDESANDVLAQTARNMGEIRSGDLSLRLVVSSEDAEVGFELDGPFALAEEGKLPVAEVEYTKIAGDETATATFLSTGDQAYVEVEGETYRLPPEQAEPLRAVGGGEGDGGLGELRIDGWLRDPELEEGEDVGGDATDRITADVDAVAVANDLLALVGSLGGEAGGALEGESAEQLRRAVESATVEVLTGKDDRILRRLALEAELSAEVPAELREQLGELPGATFELVLELANPNEPVEVEEPTDAQPLPR